ncbi:hypothetical protein Taro_001927, partial [Colocasia esculenta]|nr:hypothetical protein [Colocasia esculenta]
HGHGSSGGPPPPPLDAELQAVGAAATICVRTTVGSGTGFPRAAPISARIGRHLLRGCEGIALRPPALQYILGWLPTNISPMGAIWNLIATSRHPSLASTPPYFLAGITKGQAQMGSSLDVVSADGNALMSLFAGECVVAGTIIARSGLRQIDQSLVYASPGLPR